MCVCVFVARVPGDLQRVVFSVAARSEEGWAALMRTYTETSNDAQKRKILQALASTRDPRHISRCVCVCVCLFTACATLVDVMICLQIVERCNAVDCFLSQLI